MLKEIWGEVEQKRKIIRYHRLYQVSCNIHSQNAFPKSVCRNLPGKRMKLREDHRAANDRTWPGHPKAHVLSFNDKGSSGLQNLIPSPILEIHFQKLPDENAT
jgi:hypothetical protein